MPFESFKWKGPTKGGRSRALPVPTSGGATGTPRTLPQRPRPSVHKFQRRDITPSRRLAEVPGGSLQIRGSSRQPSCERPQIVCRREVPSGSGAQAQFGGARPHRRRLPWMYDSGRENPSICAAAERWPLRATPWPRPIRLRPAGASTSVPTPTPRTPADGTRRLGHHPRGGSGGIRAGSGPDNPRR